MQVKLTKKEHDGKISQNRKESTFQTECAVFGAPDKKDRHYNRAAPIVILRIYGTQARNYACLWINYKGVHISGGGYAGGYGYHRPSQAAENAMCDAGIILEQPIGGCGDSAIEEALISIAQHVTGKRNVLIHVAHA